MAEQNAVATQQGTQLSVAAQVKSMISQDAVKKKFTEVLGQKAPQFLASITNVVAGSAAENGDNVHKARQDILRRVNAVPGLSAKGQAGTERSRVRRQRESVRKE